MKAFSQNRREERCSKRPRTLRGGRGGVIGGRLGRARPVLKKRARTGEHQTLEACTAGRTQELESFRRNGGGSFSLSHGDEGLEKIGGGDLGSKNIILGE